MWTLQCKKEIKTYCLLMKTWKKLLLKVAYFSLIEEIFPYWPDCSNGPKNKFVLGNVTYRATGPQICILLLQMYIVYLYMVSQFDIQVLISFCFLKKRFITYILPQNTDKWKILPRFCKCKAYDKFSFVQAFYKQSKKVLFLNQISLV